jgi:hypothetical protein
MALTRSLQLLGEEEEDKHGEGGFIEGGWNHTLSLSRVTTNNDDEYLTTPTNAITPGSFLGE